MKRPLLRALTLWAAALASTAGLVSFGSWAFVRGERWGGIVERHRCVEIARPRVEPGQPPARPMFQCDDGVRGWAESEVQP